jgi:hypothetical protein
MTSYVFVIAMFTFLDENKGLWIEGQQGAPNLTPLSLCLCFCVIYVPPLDYLASMVNGWILMWNTGRMIIQRRNRSTEVETRFTVISSNTNVALSALELSAGLRSKKQTATNVRCKMVYCRNLFVFTVINLLLFKLMLTKGGNRSSCDSTGQACCGVTLGYVFWGLWFFLNFAHI